MLLVTAHLGMYVLLICFVVPVVTTVTFCDVLIVCRQHNDSMQKCGKYCGGTKILSDAELWIEKTQAFALFSYVRSINDKMTRMTPTPTVSV